jgi:competence protein ComEA
MELSRRDRVAIGLGLAAALCLAAAGWLLASSLLAAPASGQALPSTSLAPAAEPSVPAGAGDLSPGASSPAELVVDVQGAVRRPGVVVLPAGARVADALRAAGGYSRRADLNAAAGALNLAAPLADGSQVFVPMIGMTAGGPAGPTPGAPVGGGTAGGLVNINTAPPVALEALPGIGPVTVQNIVAGRAQQPFTSVDEMVQREVIDRGQLEDIRDLVTF